jgi:hypothetical protein
LRIETENSAGATARSSKSAVLRCIERASIEHLGPNKHFFSLARREQE